jgi:hypothetical protein
MIAAASERIALKTWLNVLGWQVETDSDGLVHVGVARHYTPTGEKSTVGVCTPNAAEVDWLLFEAVIKTLGGGSSKAVDGRELHVAAA